MKPAPLERPSLNIKPKNLTGALKYEPAKEPSPAFNDAPTSSYFLQKLEDARKDAQVKKERVRSVINSRIFTFDDIQESEPHEVDEKEFYSGQQISRRYVDLEQLANFFADKKVLRIPKLFAKVAPPDFEEPQYPNWLVIGILSGKTQPKTTSDGKGRYLFLTLTDFKFSIDISMFGSAMEKYNKLRLGDVIAVLNPDVYVKSDYTLDSVRTFGLSIKHKGDCLLEIAKAKNFGLCPSLKKDKSVCRQPFNKAVESCCQFHQELRMRKTAGKRMEFQGSVRVTSPVKNGRKQQMLLGKPDKLGGWTNTTIVTDQSGPKINRVNSFRKLFSSGETHEKFFNSETGEPTGMRRQLDQKHEHRRKVKDMELQDNLARSMEGAKNLKKFNAVDVRDPKENMTLEEKKALLRYAYQGTGLSNLGFDPSAKGEGRGILSIQDERERRKVSETANELRNITKNKKMNLGVWDGEIKRRRQMKEEADEILKRIKLEKPGIKGNLKPKPKAKEQLHVELDSGSDDSDDLEILSPTTTT